MFHFRCEWMIPEDWGWPNDRRRLHSRPILDGRRTERAAGETLPGCRNCCAAFAATCWADWPSGRRRADSGSGWAMSAAAGNWSSATERPEWATGKATVRWTNRLRQRLRWWRCTTATAPWAWRPFWPKPDWDSALSDCRSAVPLPATDRPGGWRPIWYRGSFRRIRTFDWRWPNGDGNSDGGWRFVRPAPVRRVRWFAGRPSSNCWHVTSALHAWLSIRSIGKKKNVKTLKMDESVDPVVCVYLPHSFLTGGPSFIVRLLCLLQTLAIRMFLSQSNINQINGFQTFLKKKMRSLRRWR